MEVTRSRAGVGYRLRMRTVHLGLATLAVACSASPEDTTPTSGDLRLLTYNVAGLPTGLAGPSVPTEERMPQIGAFLNAYDWVGLQEDFTEPGHELLLADAGHPVQYWFSEVLESTRALGSGLSTLVRVGEVVDYEETHYTACNGTLDGASDCLASKGFQITTVRLGSERVDFINTHHEAGGGLEDEAARTAQVDQILGALAATEHAVVFVGDFNMRWSDPPDATELQRYADAGLRDVCLELDCPEPDRIDRILVRDSANLMLTVSDWAVEPGYEDAEGAPLSDHDPVAATIAWETR